MEKREKQVDLEQQKQEKEMKDLRRMVLNQNGKIDTLQGHTVTLYKALDSLSEQIECLYESIKNGK